MIKEVIDSIKTAEGEAAGILEEGRKNARATAAAAHTEAEQQAADILADARQRAADGLNQAEAQARDKAQAVMDKGEEDILAQKQAARTRLDAAAGAILGKLA